jgi:peptidoglycan biosynthesis protein MviN/MurJ (putative lipid II flippase)
VAINVVLAIALIIPFGLAGAAVASAVATARRAVWLALAVHRRLGIQTSILTAFFSPRPAAAARHEELRTPAE